MKEALKQIIDLLQPVAALTDRTPFEHSEVIQRCVDASEIALEALALPIIENYPEKDNREPVAWMDRDGNFSDNNDHNCFPIPLYATTQPTPPQRTWVSLTDEQLKPHYQNQEWLEGVRFAEAAHGIKENT